MLLQIKGFACSLVAASVASLVIGTSGGAGRRAANAQAGKQARGAPAVTAVPEGNAVIESFEHLPGVQMAGGSGTLPAVGGGMGIVFSGSGAGGGCVVPFGGSGAAGGGVMPFGPGAGDWLKMFNAAPKKVKAAYLGVSASRPGPALRSQLSLPAGVGLVVDTVEEGSPAAKTGLKPFDVLHKLNDQLLVTPEQLAILVRIFKPGDDITLTVLRQAKPVTFKAKLVEKEIYDLEGCEAFGAAGMLPPGIGGGGCMVMPAGTGAFMQGSGMAGGVAGGTGQLSFSDGEHEIQITVEKGKPRLVAKDKNGNEVFSGPIATEAEMKAVPEAIRKKLASVHAVIGSGDGTFSLPLGAGPKTPAPAKPSALKTKRGDR